MQESSRDGGQLKRLRTERWGFCYGTGCLPFLSHTSSENTNPCLKLSKSHSFPTNHQSSTSLLGAISFVVCLIDRRHLTIDWSPCSSHVASQWLSALSSLCVASQTLATQPTPCHPPSACHPRSSDEALDDEGRRIPTEGSPQHHGQPNAYIRNPSTTEGHEYQRRASLSLHIWHLIHPTPPLRDQLHPELHIVSMNDWQIYGPTTPL